MAEVIWIGSYIDGLDSGTSAMKVSSNMRSTDEFEDIIKECAVAYLAERTEAGVPMDYDYNFGDIVELCEVDEFRDKLGAEDIYVEPLDNSNMMPFNHDDIWVHRWEVI